MATPNTPNGARSRKRRITQADAKSLTVASLRERLHYDPITGRFVWIASQANRVGREAGTLKTGERSKDGVRYRIINLGGVLYRAHRLAWFYMTGEWPVADIDHVNRDRTDNRWSNLRAATRAENNANRPPSPSATGVKGVIFDPRYREPWKAQMSINNRTKVIGRFSTCEAASKAYQEAVIAKVGIFARFE